MRCAVLLVLVSAMIVQSTSAQSSQNSTCAASPTVRDSAPPDPGADPVGPANWYINADRTIWVAVPEGGWRSGGTLFSGGRAVRGQKTYWVRPQGAELVISGRRIDASGPPVEAHIPCCYGTGFQIVGLFFPSAGCWEVTANAGAKELTFITRVETRVESRQQ
jgi:hypothetical protein